MNTIDGPIVFFDGTCGFCHAGVLWILRNDRKGTLRFAPLQGQTYAALDLHDKPTDMSTMVVLDQGRLQTFSSASIATLRAMGGIWTTLAWMLWIIPRPLRNLGYRMIAANRYRIAGKREVCIIPTEQTRGRMLA